MNTLHMYEKKRIKCLTLHNSPRGRKKPTEKYILNLTHTLTSMKSWRLTLKISPWPRFFQVYKTIIFSIQSTIFCNLQSNNTIPPLLIWYGISLCVQCKYGIVLNPGLNPNCASDMKSFIDRSNTLLFEGVWSRVWSKTIFVQWYNRTPWPSSRKDIRI